MKTLPLPLALLALFVVFARAQNPAGSSAKSNLSAIAAVQAADDERLAATIAVDRSRMNAVYSDDLRYAHSSGKVDTKASFIEALVSKEAVYYSVDYQERNFVPGAPGIVLMSGRAIFKVATGGQRQDLDLRFLAVWREEQGAWRLMAWQSSRPPPASSK
jgi:ketosteroid isomerase-like protein